MTLVTTIIPFHNERELLPRCVESVLRQTHRELQILLVNDGSTDDSGALADGYAGRDPRVAAIHLEKSGVSVARNAGIEAMRGEFVHFVDADDYVTPVLVEQLLADITRKRTDFVSCDSFMETKHSDGTTTRRDSYCPPGIAAGTRSTSELYPLFADLTVLLHFGICWNKLYRAATIRDSGVRFRPGLARCQDFVFNADLLPHCRTVHCGGELLYVYAEETEPGKELKVRTYHPQLIAMTTMYCRRLAADARPYCTPGQLSRIKARMADRAVVDIVRACRRDSTLTDRETRDKLAELAAMSDIREWFCHYRPGQGQSRLVPWLFRRGWIWPLFIFARRRADARYGAAYRRGVGQ